MSSLPSSYRMSMTLMSWEHLDPDKEEGILTLFIGGQKIAFPVESFTKAHDIHDAIRKGIKEEMAAKLEGVQSLVYNVMDAELGKLR